MATSHRKSRIPALSSSNCKSVTKPNYHLSGFDVSSHGSSAYETSYRYGQYSTQRKSNTSCFKANKYAANFTGPYKGAKGLFHQSPKSDRTKVYPSSAAASGRRSSIIGDRCRQKDTRQVADPKYQQTCTTKLIQFLTENHYPSQISPKFLKSPSKQDVIKVFEFLFSHLDPSIEVTPIDARVPELMAQFGYPYFITKSSLISFSGRQAIGNLLGMFEFLVDNIQYLQTVDSRELIYPSVTSDDAEIKTSLLQIVSDDVDLDEAFEELAVKIYGTDDELGALECELKKLDDELKNLEKENDYRKMLPVKKMEYVKSTDEYVSYNNYMQDYILQTEKDAIKLKAEIVDLENELAMNSEKLHEMNQKVNDQPYDIAEMQLARDRQRQFDKEINDDTKAIKQIKLSIHTDLNEISLTKDQLIKKYYGYASEVNSLLMSVNTQANKNYVPWVIEKLHSPELQDILDQLSNPESLTKSSELKKRFVDLINELNRYLIEVNVDLQAKSVKVQQKGKQLELIETEKRLELKNLQEKLAQAEQELQRYKQYCHEESKFLNEKFAHLRKSLAEKEQSVKDCAKANETRIAQLRAELSQQIVKNKELNEQNAAKLQKRRENETKILNSIEKSLIQINDMEKKHVDTMKTAVEAAKAVRGRIQRKVEEAKKNSKSSSDKTQDLSKGDKSEVSSVTLSHSKENIHIN